MRHSDNMTIEDARTANMGFASGGVTCGRQFSAKNVHLHVATNH